MYNSFKAMDTLKTLNRILTSTRELKADRVRQDSQPHTDMPQRLEWWCFPHQAFQIKSLWTNLIPNRRINTSKIKMLAKRSSTCSVKEMLHPTRTNSQTRIKFEGSVDVSQNRILLSKTIYMINQDLLVEAIKETQCKVLLQRKT